MEELRLQLGDRMPIAVSLMAKSMGITTAELSKQMELGKVYSKDVLPNFGKTLQEWARNNGALDKSLNNLRVQQARMITQTQLSGNVIFQSGWGEGLSDLYKTITEELKELEPLMKSIGRVGGSVFKAAARIVSAFGSILKAVGQALDWVTGMTGDWSAALLTITPIVSGLFMQLKFASPILAKLGGGFAILAGKILLVVGALEEVANYITGGKKGILNPTGESLSDRISKGMLGTTGKKGQDLVASGDVFGGNVLKAASVSTNLADKVLSHSLPFDTNLSGLLDSYVTGLDNFSKRSLTPTFRPQPSSNMSLGYGATQPSNIKVDVNVTGLMTDDAVNKVGNIVESKLQDAFGAAAN